MHIVIMGCGRTGATLAMEFEGRGHSVAIIDQNGEAFRRLPSEFAGQKITGVGFDRDTLVAAGIDEAFAFAAVSDGDNSNILAARVARETYSVDNVIARISDPGRAEVYQRLGIPTVAPVPWTTNQIVSRLLPGGADEVYNDAQNGMVMRRLPLNAGWFGRSYVSLEAAAKCRISYVMRFGKGILVAKDTVIQDGDELYVMTRQQDSASAERVMARSPEESK